jgi:hypothetical protein
MGLQLPELLQISQSSKSSLEQSGSGAPQPQSQDAVVVGQNGTGPPRGIMGPPVVLLAVVVSVGLPVVVEVMPRW